MVRMLPAATASVDAVEHMNARSRGYQAADFGAKRPSRPRCSHRSHALVVPGPLHAPRGVLERLKKWPYAQDPRDAS